MSLPHPSNTPVNPRASDGLLLFLDSKPDQPLRYYPDHSSEAFRSLMREDQARACVVIMPKEGVCPNDWTIPCELLQASGYAFSRGSARTEEAETADSRPVYCFFDMPAHVARAWASRYKSAAFCICSCADVACSA